jgi:hypothetical protein
LGGGEEGVGVPAARPRRETRRARGEEVEDADAAAAAATRRDAIATIRLVQVLGVSVVPSAVVASGISEFGRVGGTSSD